MERRERKFIVDYTCFQCPHDHWGNMENGHVLCVRANTVGEAVLIAEKDPYIRRESILGIREIVSGINDKEWKEPHAR